jgi:NAD(P)-dependent dehydrogenase (short-subunit alcohol dehydrogenase family)
MTDNRVAVLASTGGPVAAAIATTLRADGWVVERLGLTATAGDVTGVVERNGVIDGLVFEPGLLDGGDEVRAGQLVDGFLELAELARPHLRPGSGGGARIVAVSSRDGLGWPDRPRTAAAAGALVAASRSLALRLGQSGTTVNVVAALPPQGSPLREAGPPAGTHLREPIALTPEPVTVEDIASTAGFFLAARSGYLTGQVLYCCGGASLLSSLSV